MKVRKDEKKEESFKGEQGSLKKGEIRKRKDGMI